VEKIVNNNSSIPARLAAGSSIGLKKTSFELLMMDGKKNRLKHVERLTEINKF